MLNIFIKRNHENTYFLQLPQLTVPAMWNKYINDDDFALWLQYNYGCIPADNNQYFSIQDNRMFFFNHKLEVILLIKCFSCKRNFEVWADDERYCDSIGELHIKPHYCIECVDKTVKPLLAEVNY